MESDYTGSEKRKYKRIKRQLVIGMSLHSDNKIETINAYDMVSINDICAGGTLINYDRPMKINMLVDLNMKFAGISEPVKCIGKVIRIELPKDTKSPKQVPIYHVAVSFIAIEEKDKKAINDVVERYYAQKRFWPD